jgi:hypothetical protein
MTSLFVRRPELYLRALIGLSLVNAVVVAIAWSLATLLQNGEPT